MKTPEQINKRIEELSSNLKTYKGMAKRDATTELYTLRWVMNQRIVASKIIMNSLKTNAV